MSSQSSSNSSAWATCSCKAGVAGEGCSAKVCSTCLLFSNLLFSFCSFFLSFAFWSLRFCCSGVRFFLPFEVFNWFAIDSLRELLLLDVLVIVLSMELSEDLFELLSKLKSWLKFNIFCKSSSSSTVFTENGLVGLIPVEVKGCKSFWLGDSTGCIPNSVFNDNGTVGLRPVEVKGKLFWVGAINTGRVR